MTGVLYSYEYLKFIEPSQNVIDKVDKWIFKRFQNYPSYVSAEGALGSDENNGGGPIASPFPAPGQPSRQADNESGSNSQQPSAVPFSGRGVVLGTGTVTGYQGSNTNTYQQNVREVPKGPNPLTQKSKLVQEHNARNKGEGEESKQNKEEEEDLEIKGDTSSHGSKNEEEELLDLS